MKTTEAIADWDIRQSEVEALDRDVALSDHEATPPEVADRVWAQLYRHQRPMLDRWVCAEYLSGVATLCLPADRVPLLARINAVIRPLTGWKAIRTHVRYSAAPPWYRRFARREFMVTDYMRSEDELEFTPEPDMFHDIFGHLPFLVDRAYARLQERFAEAFLRADEARREDIKRMAWFSTEFGLVREGRELKAIGAGLISSIGELRAVMSGAIEVRPFTVDGVLERDKAVWQLNERLFAFESFAAMDEELSEWLEE